VYDRKAGVTVVLPGPPWVATRIWSKSCQVPISPRVSTVNSVGRSCGSVTRKNRCRALAPSIMAASSTSTGMFCSAAMNSSMKVPDVVKTAMVMKTDIAMLGPASQFHSETPSTSVSVRNAGPSSTPTAPSSTCTTPRGSSNQLGPSMLRKLSAEFTTPLELNRNRNTTVMATELVTDGK
jgi:hypothetical protein